VGVEERRRANAGQARTEAGAAPAFRIFLNYRREDASGYAGRLWDTLLSGVDDVPGFAEEQVFRVEAPRLSLTA
jgi:hypothetical protein